MSRIRAVATLACYSLFGALSLTAAPAWQKLQTDDVVILSDASEKDMVEYAVGFSAFRHAFRQTFAPAPATTPPPIIVLLFRRQSVFEKHVPAPQEDSTLLSFSTQVDGEALVALSVSGGRERALAQTFESETVWELGRVGCFVPIWMSQGAGEVLSSLRMRKAGYVLGEAPEGFSEAWQHADLHAWPKFFNIHTESAEYTGREDAGVFHVQAWALMHRVLLGDDGGAQFRAMADKLHESTAVETVTSTLGVKERDLTADIARHLRAEPRREIAFDVEGLRRRLRPQPAPEVEVHVQLANLLLAAGKPAEAEQELATAIRLAPEAAAVKEAQARRALRDGDEQLAVRCYRDAIATGSRNSWAYMVCAEKSMNDASMANRAGDGGPVIATVIEQLRKALQLHPGNLRAYQLLGRAFFLAPTVTADDVAELSRGVGSSGDGEWVRYYRALLYRRLKQSAEYAADLHRLAAAPGTPPQLRDIVLDRMGDDEVEAASKEVESLVERREFDKANAIIATALAGNVRAEPARRYEQLQAWVSESHALNTIQILLQQGKRADCQSAAKEFLDDFPRSSAAANVKRMLNELSAAP